MRLNALGLTILAAMAQSPSPAPKPPPAQFWTLPGVGRQTLYVLGAVDGDTLDCAYLVPVRVRVYGINSPEKNTAAGKVAKEAAAKLTGGQLLPAELYGREKYGRLLADLILPDGRYLSRAMIDGGNAKPYDGHGPRPAMPLP
jgi:endonuclease YncB( thermonuclease family)